MAEGLKARFDTTHQNFEVFQRALPLPDGLPNLNGGLPPPADGFPWHPIPKTSILQLRLLRSLPSESAHPVTASKNLQFLIATTGKICYNESTNSSQNLNLAKECDCVEWLFLLISYLPIISIVVGLTLLISGFVLRKSKKHLSTGLLIVGGVCVGICLLIYIALFLVGALGIGPVPN